ncbi:hypothetical protein NLU13_7186 [Sarocladium strictum]|uniref:Mating-type switching protein swi10 n=1 Tax=Sarocladium strictum TaxID=5046 RepID=A0AA39L5B0_SARSR|nr:hypothetical protein NLU13_7186 [Sarocladium strictum]
MDYSKSPSSPDQPGFAANLKPVRRRLQKLTPKTKIFGAKRSSHDSGISTGDSPAAPREMSSIGGNPGTGSLAYNPFADESALPLPPDLSDSKWLDYIERSGLMFHEPTVTESVPKPMRRKPSPIHPELSHLARADGARPSLDSASSGSVPNSASTASTKRRHAKTPVFRIGQLEGKIPAKTEGGFGFGRDPWIAAKTSSVELIAEQYRALLEHRDALEEERVRQLERDREERENDTAPSIHTTSSSVYTAYQPEPAFARPSSPVDVSQEASARHACEDSSVNIILEPVRNSTIITQQTPTSTGGAYNGSDESAIYFKPVSVPHSHTAQCNPLAGDSDPSPSGQDQAVTNETPDSLSLQICLDLLTKELSSIFADRSSRTGTSSALQIWVMIEAYERLQDQVACMDELSEVHKRTMQMVFRSWLGTLYAVHDMMSGLASANERQLEALAEAVD